MKKYPPHDANGFYLMNGQPQPGACYGRAEPPDEEQVETAYRYLLQLTPTKKARVSSYHLKHRAENWGKRWGGSTYVSNGALIEAAIRLGLVIRPYGINANIGVSQREVRALKQRDER